MLTPYRVLDLTDQRGEVAGKVLSDLGADVVRVEPPDGSPARRCDPRFPDGSGTEHSLQFLSFNRNKRSIALDLRTATDRELFLRLVETASFVIESAPPGILAGKGIGFEDLCSANPRIVYVQITPFGSDGPYADWAAADLTIAAMGGPVAIQGVRERAPVRVSVPQVWRHAGAEAAVAALVGHARMLRTGEAQLIDVSAQCAMTWTLLNAMEAEAIQGRDYQRTGAIVQLGLISMPLVFPCSDGFVVMIPHGPLVNVVVHPMIEEGLVDESWADEDWLTYDYRLQFGEPIAHSFDEVLEALRGWLRKRRKAELMEWGLRHGVTVAPVNTIPEVLGMDHLEVRGFWEELEVPSAGSVRIPGVFARSSSGSLRVAGAAPGLDEHAQEIRTELGSAGPAPLEPVTPGSLPLLGLKVVDFSWIGVGPMTARCLGDHGATVVRVESESRPDALRTVGPFKDGQPGINRSQFYGAFNTSKLGLQLDLKHPAALGIARRLIAWADVAIESFTPGTIDKLGIGYPVARELNSSIVMVSTCLMGQTGPAAALAGYGYHAGAVAGFYEITGWPDLSPDGPWVAYTDTIAPRLLIATLLAAIDHRRRTGKGQYIDAAQLEMGLQFLAPEILEYQLTGYAASRIGNRSRFAAPQGIYPCKGEDRFCAIAVESNRQWRALRAALGDPEWARDPLLDAMQERIDRHDEIDAGLESWTRDRESRAAVEILQTHDVPAGMVQRSSDLLRDPQYRHRGFYKYLEHGEMGRIPYAGHQFRIRGYESGPRFPAPLLGEHLHEILSGVLGMDDEEIAEALAAGAVG